MVHMDDLWQVGQPLPDGPRLTAMAARLAEVWQLPQLAAKVRITYNPRMRTTLGRAFLTQDRIELNPRLLMASPAELPATLAHEMAHLGVYWKFRKLDEPHGPHFRSLMSQVGFVGHATHRVRAAAALRRPRGRFLYLHVCSDCGGRFVARSSKRGYFCKRCGPGMRWEIFRLPNDAAGRARLHQMMAAQT